VVDYGGWLFTPLGKIENLQLQGSSECEGDFIFFPLCMVQSLLQVVSEWVWEVPKHRASQGMTGALGLLCFLLKYTHSGINEHDAGWKIDVF